MKEKKNIDRLFQEKFKDFEVHPSDQVWKNIVEAKKKKEDRKIVPIWWRFAGVAALVLILVTTGIALWNNSSDLNNTTPELVQSDPNGNEDSNPNESINTNIAPGEDVNSDSKEIESGLAIENTTSNKATSGEEKDKLMKEENSLFGVQDTQGAIANQDIPTNSQKTNTKENKNQPYIDNTTTINTDQSTTGDVTTIKEKQENTPQKRSDFIDPNITIDKSVDDTAIAVTEDTANTSQNEETENKSVDEEENKKSLVDEAARIAEATTEDDVQEKDAIARRWDVGAVAAPVYYGDFGGSGIDPQFKDNTKTSDVNLSYGVQVSYAVTPKFKVRTGVSNVDLNYNTQDISFAPSNSARTLRGIDFSQNASFLDITDRVNPSSAVAGQNEDSFGQGGNTFSNGEIQQNVGYIEIPLEAIYVLSDKRLGVELIGGVSTLLLNNNEVFLASNGLRTSLGTSNALNDVSFTTNVGLGLNYKVTEKVKINIEPSLKYQLNAYSNSVGEFKPYYVGLYTGVNYRF
ncbi:hypothetical protein [uncultured Dokdonia sp.]|uniref:hypothetical protein n=1 Tax=uncultured Dokdonia sp. TaxID=575653 RepID=UPI00260B3EB2|nr:hypothetical protein [uncultured Dokdonia sp.]